MSTENSSKAEVVEEWHLVDSSRHRPLRVNTDEPLVDTTEKMTLRSKRTERLQKKMQKKVKKRLHSEIHSFLDLPSELLVEVLTYLRPGDLFSILRVNRSAKGYIEANESVICDEILNLRYHILAKCFPLPILLENIDKSVHPVLLGPKHQQRLIIHKAPYLHISPSDPENTCSCMACVLAWNNLCLIVDLAHWQKNLDEREPVCLPAFLISEEYYASEPVWIRINCYLDDTLKFPLPEPTLLQILTNEYPQIPMLGRGMRPAWNSDLTRASAAIVDRVIRSPLWRARVLQRHLDTTVRTIVRSAAIRKKTGASQTDVNPSKRHYHLSNKDIAAETDEFLQRSGPPSFEFPFTRDNYYMLLSYLPNRRWETSEGGRWIYYGALHENDLAWAKTVYDREQSALQSIARPQKAAEVDSAPAGAG